MYDEFVRDFKEDEESLLEEVKLKEKDEKDYERREKEELKRLEKVFKKESNEIEDLFNDTSLTGEKGLK